MMHFEKEESELKGVYKIHLERFTDQRGKIINLFDVDQFPEFKIDKLTKSSYNVLRGLHGDSYNDKLIYCLQGKIQLVIVNFDPDSDEYLQQTQIEIDENSHFAVFVPHNFLNGHYCMSKECLFYYKWSESYVEPQKQFSVAWDDKDLNIPWRLKEPTPILSSRDKMAKTIEEQR